MSNDEPEGSGRLDDDAEEHERSDDPAGGEAARGDYDPAEGSPGDEHPVGKDFPDESVRYGDERRRRSDARE